MPLVNGLVRTPKKLTPNRVSAQLSHEPLRAGSLIRLRDSHVRSGNSGPAPWASSGFGIGSQPIGHLGLISVFCGEKLKNEAGMFMIIKDFYFWNRLKAGMLMKTSKLLKKAGMFMINKAVMRFPENR